MSDPKRSVRLYLCECGPIIKEALDLDALQDGLAQLDGVDGVVRHATLCSPEGREWLAKDLADHPDSGVVVAGCSVREHGPTFAEVLRQAGVNPYLLGMANIREQCAWVTPDRTQAVAKAHAITDAVVARVREQEPLEERHIDCHTDVLVVGAGVAGLTTAKLLAEGDRQVHLVERTPAIGGRTPLLGDLYPSLECASCVLEPLMDEVLHNANIQVHTYAEVDEVLGFLGNFTVKIRKRARHVEPDACYGCSTCHTACPVEVPSEVDEGLATRRALYIPYPGALPSATLLDEASCLHFKDQSCDACVAACPFGNIDLEAKDEIIEARVGAIVLATGAAPRPLDVPDQPDHVISAMAMERLLNSAGPTSGEIQLPDQATPRSIALIHCCDQTGAAPVVPCSKVCCMAFAKHVHQIHEKLPECDIFQILWDRCAVGRGFREFALATEQIPRLTQIRLTPKDRIIGLDNDSSGSRVRIRYSRGPMEAALHVDLAVLAPPLAGADNVDDLARTLRLERDPAGFLLEEHERLLPFRTRVEGILVAGCARGPGDIQESAAQGAAAAGSALAALVPGRQLRVEPATAIVDTSRCGACHTCVLSCPYQAITFDKQSNAAEVNAVLCRGCGTCAAACPTGAIQARHFTDRQVLAELAAHTAATPPPTAEVAPEATPDEE